jgi:hypothetical protein
MILFDLKVLIIYGIRLHRDLLIATKDAFLQNLLNLLNQVLKSA